MAAKQVGPHAHGLLSVNIARATVCGILFVNKIALMVDVLFKTGNRLYLYKQEAIQQRSETQTFNPAGINMLLAAQRQIDVFNGIGVFFVQIFFGFLFLKILNSYY